MKIPLGKIFFWLLLIEIILLVMHFFPEDLSAAVHHRFNLNGEGNVPAWFSATLLFCVSLSALIVYLLGRRTSRDPRVWGYFWLGLSITFCFLSLDEGARLHETIDKYTEVRWLIVYAPFAAIFLALCVSYLVYVNQDKILRNWILGGLVVYLSGALLFEFLGYMFYQISSSMEQVEYVVEEGLEMLGATMMLIGCFWQLNRMNAQAGSEVIIIPGGEGIHPPA